MSETDKAYLIARKRAKDKMGAWEQIVIEREAKRKAKPVKGKR